MINNVSGSLIADEKNSVVKTTYNTYININGTVIVKYIDNNTKEELVDKIEKTDKVGKKYEL